jgi:hypothetical protein
MTAVNHAVFGSLVVAYAGNPIIGLPLAFLSHFLLDAMPHFGAHTVAKPGSHEYKAIIKFDTFMTASFVLVVGFAGYRAGLEWWLLPLGGMIGWSPDIMWYKHYKSDIAGKPREWDPVRRLHKKIQRFEISWGWAIEMLWFVLLVALLSNKIFL